MIKKPSFIDYIKAKPYHPERTDNQYNIVARGDFVHLILKYLNNNEKINIEPIIWIDYEEGHIEYDSYPNYPPLCSPHPDYIFLPISIDLKSLNVFHMIGIIINCAKQEIELFEPNGIKTPWFNPIYDFFSKELEEIYPHYRFVAVETHEGIQCISTREICAAFVLLYFWTRIYDPCLTSYEVLSSLCSFRRRDLNIFMDKFIYYLYEQAEQTRPIEYFKIFLINQENLDLLKNRKRIGPRNYDKLWDLNDYLWDVGDNSGIINMYQYILSLY